MANTFYNAKKPEVLSNNPKKNAKKKVTWEEKIVQKPQTGQMNSTLTKFKDQLVKKEETRSSSGLKSILKGFPNENQD